MYLSIDIEPTGLDPETNQILEVGVVIDDLVRPINELPTFHCYVRHETYLGNAYALSLNSNILRELSQTKRTEMYSPDGTLVLEPNEIFDCLTTWLEENKVWKEGVKFTVAGKNFGIFDFQFLKRLPYYGADFTFSHKTLDPGPLYFNPLTDDEIPSLDECLKRGGINKEVSHTAVEDALDVVKVLRSYWNLSI